MKFKDIHIDKLLRFSLGTELVSGKFYISIPISNQLVDYEEYYEIPETVFKKYPSNIEDILILLKKCKEHDFDDNLLVKPGKDRGVA